VPHFAPCAQKIFTPSHFAPVVLAEVMAVVGPIVVELPSGQ